MPYVLLKRLFLEWQTKNYIYQRMQKFTTKEQIKTINSPIPMSQKRKKNHTKLT